MEKNKKGEIVYSPFPETNPDRLFDYLAEIQMHPEKKTKTISLNSILTEASYALVRHGFWFACGSELLFYPMPTTKQLEEEYYYWWKFVN